MSAAIIIVPQILRQLLKTATQMCIRDRLHTVCGENVIHGVEFIHRTGQIGQRLSVLLVNAYTDFADLIAGLFGNRQHTGIFKHKCLPILVGIRGILDIHNAVPVSYTHLDVYKRQAWLVGRFPAVPACQCCS